MSKKVVEIDSLCFSYPDGNRALEGISLDIFEGEKVAVIGPNGAGKSTLLLHLNGVLQSNGNVRVFGKKVDRKNLRGIRQKVGLVFQNPDDQLFCPTVFDDVAFGPRNMSLSPEEIKSRVEESLTAVGLAGFEDRSPFHMSVGEKRRVAIATVLSMNAEILAFDEPTSNLDPKGKRELAQLLGKLGRTQIVITQDLSLAGKLCDRVILISKGEKVAEGIPEEILSDHSLLKAHNLE